MTDLDDFQRRVEQYFQCGQRNEPGGRIILDLLGALRVECAKNDQLFKELRDLRAGMVEAGGVIAKLQDENERLRAEIELVSK